jgi:hypothetical protein
MSDAEPAAHLSQVLQPDRLIASQHQGETIDGSGELGVDGIVLRSHHLNDPIGQTTRRIPRRQHEQRLAQRQQDLAAERVIGRQ